MRAVGYAPHRDPKSAKDSYMRRVGPHFYPRFHLYVLEYTSQHLVLDLHLDAKEPSYAGTPRHAGEYNSDTVRAEAERIREAR